MQPDRFKLQVAAMAIVTREKPYANLEEPIKKSQSILTLVHLISFRKINGTDNVESRGESSVKS